MLDVVMTAAIGAIFGIFGYVVTEFVVAPIRKYRDLRFSLISDFIFFANKLWDGNVDERVERSRRHSSDLTALVREGLPRWYVCFVRLCRIDLDAAATELIRYSNSSGQEAKTSAADICKMLRIKHLA